MDPSSPESEPSVATAKEVILSVSSLSKTYPSVGRGPLPVLEELNLDVVKGEVLAIVGESGVRQKYAASNSRRTGPTGCWKSPHGRARRV